MLRAVSTGGVAPSGAALDLVSAVRRHQHLSVWWLDDVIDGVEAG